MSFAAALLIARRVYENHLRKSGKAVTLRKRLQRKPNRDSTSDIELAYNRKDPASGSPVDWDDVTIFDTAEESSIKKWKRAKDRSPSLFALLQKVDGRVEVSTALGSDAEEGDMLVIDGGVWEIITVNTPSFAICVELEIIKRG